MLYTKIISDLMTFYKLFKDIAIGSPISDSVAETFLHYFENNYQKYYRE
jgi:hypothetical protein